ncbi:MAG: cytochrome c oxidase subunit II [Microcoleaceae cyanobacterium]
MNIPSTILTMLFGIGLTLVSLWYGQHNDLMPVAASAEAAEVDVLFRAMLTVAFGLAVFVQCILVFSMVKFRRRKDDNTDGPPIHGNIPLEIVWTAIPAFIVLAIGIYSFEIYNQMGGLDPMVANVSDIHAHHHRSGAAIAAPLPGSENSLDTPVTARTQVAIGIGASPDEQGQTADVVVDVMGLQYAWIFTYQDSGVVAGELHIPVGAEVQLNIAAQDVLHAFWLPQFRLKQDAIPGRTTQLRFTPTKPGTYPVVCAELCGGYHGSMKTQMIVEEQNEYDAWVSENAIAQSLDNPQTVAMNPADMTQTEFLTPYAAELGVNAQTLHSLHPAE